MLFGTQRVLETNALLKSVIVFYLTLMNLGMCVLILKFF